MCEYRKRLHHNNVRIFGFYKSAPVPAWGKNLSGPFAAAAQAAPARAPVRLRECPGVCVVCVCVLVIVCACSLKYQTRNPFNTFKFND